MTGETVLRLCKRTSLFLADGFHHRLTLHQSGLSHLYTTKVDLKITLHCLKSDIPRLAFWDS